MTRPLGRGNTDTKHTNKASYSFKFVLARCWALQISKGYSGVCHADGPFLVARVHSAGKDQRLKAAVEEGGGTETEKKTEMETGCH